MNDVLDIPHWVVTDVLEQGMLGDFAAVCVSDVSCTLMFDDGERYLSTFARALEYHDVFHQAAQRHVLGAALETATTATGRSGPTPVRRCNLAARVSLVGVTGPPLRISSFLPFRQFGTNTP